MSNSFAAQADAQLAALLEGLPPEQVAQALSVLINRAATRLHQVARAQATARKGEPAWPTWAQLQNVSRTLVLQSSTGRDLAAKLDQSG